MGILSWNSSSKFCLLNSCNFVSIFFQITSNYTHRHSLTFIIECAVSCSINGFSLDCHKVSNIRWICPVNRKQSCRFVINSFTALVVQSWALKHYIQIEFPSVKVSHTLTFAVMLIDCHSCRTLAKQICCANSVQPRSAMSSKFLCFPDISFRSSNALKHCINLFKAVLQLWLSVQEIIVSFIRRFMWNRHKGAQVICKFTAYF